MTGDDARIREGFEALSDGARFGDDCPAAERLWAGAHGELPPPEVEALTAHLAECGACAEAWRVAAEFGPASATAITPQEARSWWLPLAAALVMAVGGFQLYRAVQPAGVDVRPPDATVVQNPAPPPFVIPLDKPPVRVAAERTLTWRGSGNAQAFLQALADALAPYRADDYRAAIPLLETVARRYPDASEPHFYLGVSRLLAGDASGAVAPLQRAVALSDGPAQQDARIRLASAYERAGDRTRARAELQTACAADSSSDACRLARSFE